MDKQSRASMSPVAIWIYTGVFMLMVQVILGGITRLTGSGLSITEWNVVTGTLPPLNHEQWLAAFDKYRQTPQYLLLNTHFTLADFKYIFFWEWFHRLWARLIGFAFLIPFVYFLLRKRFKKDMIWPLVTLFLCGALLGAVGWIMVASGLTGDAIYVKPTRLALHFVFALGVISYTFWFALQLSVPSAQRVHKPRLHRGAIFITVVLFVQLIYGALMAGHKAATAAPTFPDINGEWIPASLTRFKPVLINLVENKITIHFLHRGVAYLLFIMTLIWTIKAVKVSLPTTFFRRSRLVSLSLLFVQIILGALSVITSPSIIPGEWGVFQWLAELHQVTGMLFLLSMIWMIYLTGKGKTYT